MNAKVLWTAETSNSKTGNVPTGWVGTSIEEARHTCKGCPLLDNGCYAHQGSPRIGFSSLIKKYREGADRSLSTALQRKHKRAKMVRLGALGDPAGVNVAQATDIKNQVKEAGIDLIGYTHFWRRPHAAKIWKGSLMASCDTVQDLKDAIRNGWRATIVVPEDYPIRSKIKVGAKEHPILVCPAQTSNGKVTCNDCRLCDGSKRGPHIAFRVHGAAKAQVDFSQRGL